VLRVGLTGGLASGKSTVAGYLRDLGAHVVEADELGRALMEPGQAVFSSIIECFGLQVVGEDGRLNRARLAELAFREGRIHDLNAIVHPAVIEAQRHWMDEVFGLDPSAVAVVESALIFEVERDARARGEAQTVLADWRRRFDRVVVVTAPEKLKVERYVGRLNPDEAGREAVAADAKGRLALQIPDDEKAARADYVLENTGDREALHAQVLAVWERLKAESNKCFPAEF
jgi:dephospho-CoA kinase